MSGWVRRLGDGRGVRRWGHPRFRRTRSRDPLLGSHRLLSHLRCWVVLDLRVLCSPSPISDDPGISTPSPSFSLSRDFVWWRVNSPPVYGTLRSSRPVWVFVTSRLCRCGTRGSGKPEPFSMLLYLDFIYKPNL